MTQEINRQFGDQRFFNVSSDANRQFRVLFDADGDDVTGTEETSTPLQVVMYLFPLVRSTQRNRWQQRLRANSEQQRILTSQSSTVAHRRALFSRQRTTQVSCVSQTYRQRPPSPGAWCPTHCSVSRPNPLTLRLILGAGTRPRLFPTAPSGCRQIRASSGMVSWSSSFPTRKRVGSVEPLLLQAERPATRRRSE